MSRIGRAPITLPSGVKVNIKDNTISVEGKKGKLEWTCHPAMSLQEEDGTLSVNRESDSREHRALHGLTRALVNNMVMGVSEGFRKQLEIIGVGYRAEMKGDDLVLHLGFSHPVEMPPPENITFAVENRGRLITVDGIDKQVVGEVSAKIRKLRPPEPYKGKGVRYLGEFVRRKAGKAGKV